MFGRSGSLVFTSVTCATIMLFVLQICPLVYPHAEKTWLPPLLNGIGSYEKCVHNSFIYLPSRHNALQREVIQVKQREKNNELQKRGNTNVKKKGGGQLRRRAVKKKTNGNIE